ncbi:hypothetical protein [Halomonas stenophila]|uniref:Uncharacterized protein n=1 Tax=Halomonas stenophila TaxID=795312 RepID=A0A7W5HLA8_9GAMM|nr:hypothetical protein [Halomonas stenophila]MBB3230878.1 hypothetical protein [Halomonas stenophila]
MSYGPLFAVLILSASMAQAEEAGVDFAMGGERFVLTPACIQRVEHAAGDAGLVHLRFDMAETPGCFGAFRRLLSTHQGERLTVTFRGERLLEAVLHIPLEPENNVLVSRHPGAAVAAAEFLRGVPHAEAP